MKHIKRSIIYITMLVFLTGCSTERLILVPQTQDYPTFNTEDFTVKEPFPLTVWEEEDEKGSYLIGNKDHMLKFIQWSKQNRSDYNTLLNELKKFNNRIKELNNIQNAKKPLPVNEYAF
jgi:hypothetical protein